MLVKIKVQGTYRRTKILEEFETVLTWDEGALHFNNAQRGTYPSALLPKSEMHRAVSAYAVLWVARRSKCRAVFVCKGRRV
jgi:hypothetical protein